VQFDIGDPEITYGSVKPPKEPTYRVYKLPKGVTHGVIEWPPWLKIACQEEDKHVTELRGLEENNQDILKYIGSVPALKDIYMKIPVALADEWTVKGKKRLHKTKKVNSGFRMGEVDETAWCGCFVNWCLKQVRDGKDFAPAHSLAADWETYGENLEEPILGAVTVVHHDVKEGDDGTTSSGFHVAFYAGGPADEPVLLGGNQSDSVCRKQFTHPKDAKTKWKVLAYRWPPNYPQKP
jgi:uncharacterized protein (TIGR02594 family)